MPKQTQQQEAEIPCLSTEQDAKKQGQSETQLLEIAKAEVDSQGYDIIAEANGVIRHIQLKSSCSASTTAKQKVHVALAHKPSACVVLLIIDKETLELKEFHFFGEAAGQPLPDLQGLKNAKHTKANAQGYKAQRAKHRLIPLNEFKKLETIEALYDKLFIREALATTDE